MSLQCVFLLQLEDHSLSLRNLVFLGKDASGDVLGAMGHGPRLCLPGSSDLKGWDQLGVGTDFLAALTFWKRRLSSCPPSASGELNRVE